MLADAFDIHTVSDLAHHYPRRYIDRSSVETIGRIRIGAYVTVIGRVRRVDKRYTRKRQSMVTVKIGDGTGFLDLPFFNQPWTAGLYREDMEVAVSGVATMYKGRLQLAKQEVEILRGDEGDLVHTGRITPVHAATEGISARTIRELVHRSFARLGPIADPLPVEIVRDEGLGSYDRALQDIHFPVDEAALQAARERLKFDELFTLELGVAFRKHRVEAESAGVAHDLGGPLTDRLLAAIPFEPTEAQRRAMHEIGDAMAAPRPMNVLLQGDVGAGKTLVALDAALVAIGSGHQAAIMAPTEVLAGQHLRSVQALLAGMDGVPYLQYAASRSSTPAGGGDQASLLDAVELDGDAAGRRRRAGPDVRPPHRGGHWQGPPAHPRRGGRWRCRPRGRHARPGAGGGHLRRPQPAVVDEQHRFGLHQRTALKRKGGEPDVLIMTATPIPRTLALTYYGDLDVVVLDELPAGRWSRRSPPAPPRSGEGL